MKHFLETTDLDYFTSKTQIAGQFGNGHHKSLMIESKLENGSIISRFVVYHNTVFMLGTSSLSDAIKEYNKY